MDALPLQNLTAINDFHGHKQEPCINGHGSGQTGVYFDLKKKNKFVSYRQMLTNQEFNNTMALGWPHYSFYLL